MALSKIVGIEGYIQTTYLAVYPDKLLLLDSGCRCDVDKIIHYITQVLNRPLSQLKTVMVTHMHPDHAGGAALLKVRTGCQIVSFKAPQPWYNGVKGRLNHLNDLGLTYYVASRLGNGKAHIWYAPILKADVYLTEGDSIPDFDDWQILETPGHTDHDISLWHDDSRQVYVSDTILKVKDRFLSPYLISQPILYKQSLVKLKALRANNVILAHGGQDFIAAEIYDELIQAVPPRPRQTANIIKSGWSVLARRKPKMV